VKLKINKPKSIASVDDSVLDSNAQFYEAYVYEYTNIKNGKKYIGSKKGMFDGSYWHSSENYEFCRIFSEDEPLLNLKIINYGFYSDMQKLEHDMQSEVSAHVNPMYYNGAIAPSGNKELIDIEKCQSIVDMLQNKILNGEYKFEDKTDVSKLTRLQVRTTDDSKHITAIVDRMLETGLNDAQPILIWEESATDETDLIGDGGHTILASLRVRNINQLKTIRMPRSFVVENAINEMELRHIGLMMNPISKVKKKETDEDDAIKQLLLIRGRGTQLSGSKYARELLKSLGFYGRKISNLIKSAESKYREGLLAKGGQKIAVYNKDHPDLLRKLEQKADSLRNEHTIVIDMCSVYPSKILRKIIQDLNADVYKDRYRVVLLTYHNNLINKDNWEKKELAAFKDEVKGLLKQMIPRKIKFTHENGRTEVVETKLTFEIHEMPFTVADTK
tara:strand:- start:41 stop:1378 length:1338 start_codon:yes stop_codon:yes gene_type:complete